MCDENKTIRTKNTDAPWALSLGNTELLVRLLNTGKGRAARHDAAQREWDPPFYSWGGLRTRGQRFVAVIPMSGSWVQIWYIQYARCHKRLKISELALWYKIQSNDVENKWNFPFLHPSMRPPAPDHPWTKCYALQQCKWCLVSPSLLMWKDHIC